MSARDLVYVGVTGTTTRISGLPGTHVHTIRGDNGVILGILIRLALPEDDTWDGPMVHVTVDPERYDEDGTPHPDGNYRQIIDAAPITRDTFDDLTGITAARHKMGWRK